jgi:Trypsin-co-occurring domain 1
MSNAHKVATPPANLLMLSIMGQIKQAMLNGKTVYVEVSDLEFDPGPQAVSAGRPGEQALDLSAELKESIVGYCGALTESFAGLETKRRPAKVVFEFGLKLSADAKFYFVNAAGEASIKVTAEWTYKA